MFVLFFPLPCRFGKKPCRIHAKKPDCQGNTERYAPQSGSLDMLRNEQEATVRKQTLPSSLTFEDRGVLVQI